MIEIIILVLLLLWLNKDSLPSGFENNNYYFQGNENDSMYVGNLLQPTITRRITLPKEW